MSPEQGCAYRNNKLSLSRSTLAEFVSTNSWLSHIRRRLLRWEFEERQLRSSEWNHYYTDRYKRQSIYARIHNESNSSAITLDIHR